MASSGRTLGKARVLGTAKPTPPPRLPSQAALPDRLLSPSASSLSLDSQVSTEKSSNEDFDISAAVAMPARDQAAVAVASSKMVCPICGEEMVTLLQLNRHLDDAHKNLEVVEQDEVKTWFKTQMVKAKKFQPLAVLDKLKGLDVFESNNERRLSSSGGTSEASNQEPAVIRPDPEQVVTKEHWQRYTSDGTCSDPMCGKRLGGSNGNVNCRKCGKLFCGEHTTYEMKLSRSAQHEPVRGTWCRVCETCYKSREGYNDHSGPEIDHMAAFTKIRRKAVDQSYLEVSRLEKRLTKLTQLLIDPRLEQEQTTLGYLWSLSGVKTQQRLLEESVVAWEDDAFVTNCPFCQQEFATYTFKRHHCRLCGRVVCGDPATECSSTVALNVENDVNQQMLEKGSAQTAVDVRMCKDCKHTIFSRSDFENESARVPLDAKAFQNLKQFERGIRMMLPRFQKLIAALQDPDKPPTPAQLAEATKVRKRLTDSFTQFDVAARRIRDLETKSPTQLRLQQQIYVQATHFLQLHMLPLKTLPKILKHAAPHAMPQSPSHSRTNSLNTLADTNGYLSPMPSGQQHAPRNRSPLNVINSSSQSPVDASSQTSADTRLSELESEEKSLRERLIVLEEQKFLVQEMLVGAQRRRKVEEAESLSRNVEDLGIEVDKVRALLENVVGEFEDAFVGRGVG